MTRDPLGMRQTIANQTGINNRQYLEIESLRVQVAELRGTIVEVTNTRDQLGAHVRQAEAEVAELTRKLAEAQKDTERIDWIDALPHSITITQNFDQPKSDSLPKFRATIDLARGKA